MPGRDFDDDAELRPLGEATHVPDYEFDTKRGDRHRGATRLSNPVDDGSTPECRSCGASIPSGRTKCRFCLSNYVEPLDVDGIADETVVVETFTTTEFESDAPWQSPQMNVLVIVMDLTQPTLTGEPPADIVDLDWNGLHRGA